MHILIAPNAFKNSLDARQVALAIEEGLMQSRLQCTTELFPIADGGDGTGSLIVERCNGERILQEVLDPLGRKITSSFGLIDNGKTAVIEMADASGLRLLKKEKLNPMRASSYGTGELIKAALDKGVKRIIVAMGGSATVDGGCGILNALGIEFFDIRGNKLKAIPEELINMAKIDSSGLDERIYDAEIVVLCDVSNNLLGPQGAAAVFGPQKGAGLEDIKALDHFLKNFVKVTAAQTGWNMDRIKYGGAAGGASAGVYAWLGAKLVNGIEYFLHLTGFDEALERANMVITGEGSLDSQTLQGKGPYGVAVAAKKKGVKVIGLAGTIEEDTELGEYFDELICINQEPFDVTEAMKRTEENLVRVARRLGDRLA
ncbi:MAG TPA: glycerate kinase [Mucilaginibacter sp.]|jgi:glycerate kinase|nr:glycerate kinase [Mucilaginibacter sp.]